MLPETLSVCASVLLECDGNNDYWDPVFPAELVRHHDVACFQTPVTVTLPIPEGRQWQSQCVLESHAQLMTLAVVRKLRLQHPQGHPHCPCTLGRCVLPRRSSRVRTPSIGIPRGTLCQPWDQTLFVATHIPAVGRSAVCRRILAWRRTQRLPGAPLPEIVIMGQQHSLLRDDLMPLRKAGLRSVYELTRARSERFPLYHTGTDIWVSPGIDVVESALLWGDRYRYPTISATLRLVP